VKAVRRWVDLKIFHIGVCQNEAKGRCGGIRAANGSKPFFGIGIIDLSHTLFYFV
jgi:hypothetical protein